MTESVSQTTQRLLNTVSYAGLLSATVAGGFTYHAVKSGLEASGLGSWSVMLAFGAAAGMTACYAGFLHLALKGLAPLPKEQRQSSHVAVIAGTTLLLIGSAYPNVIVGAGGIAAGIEDRSYIASIASAGDRLKAAARSAEQIETVLASARGKIDVLAGLESTGGLSGTPASGALADLMSARSRAVATALESLAEPRERVADEIARIDQATDKMRQSLIQSDLTPEQRRMVMQRHGDDARSAAISVAALTPVAALQSFADDLMGPQIEPKWSGKADIRVNQQQGFSKFKDELKRLGKAVSQQTGDLREALKVTVPVYDPQPASVLVIKHWHALTNFYALALALDGLPLILYLVACALYDAGRRPVAALAMSKSAASEDHDTVDIGPHPHETASRARNHDVRRNGRDASDRKPL